MVAQIPVMTLVLHVVTRTNIGGVSNYLGNIVRATTPNAQHIIVRGSPSVGEGDFFAINPINVRVINIPSLQRAINPWKELVGFVSLVRTIRSIRPDVVHTHMAKAGVLGRLAAVLCRVPIRIHTFHGHLLVGYFSPRAVRMIIFIERSMQRATTQSITNGERVRRDLIQQRVLTEATSVSIPPAVDSFELVPKRDARQRLSLPDGCQIVGFVGRLAEVKRPDRFLKLAEALPETTFVIFGDGPLGEQVRRNASSIPNLIIAGWVEDIATMYSALDLLVLTSDNEAAAIVLIEAAVSGVPTIAMNVGSVSEVVIHEETGLLINDERDLAPATTRLLQDSELRVRLGQNARRRASTEFGLNRLAQKHLNLYVQQPPTGDLS